MATSLPQLTRAQLRQVFPTDAMIRAYEALQQSLQFTPVQVENVSAAVAAAQATADAAQATADAAQAAASGAQGGADSLKAVAFVTIGASSATPNERSLAVDPIRLAMTDGGPGASITLSTSELYSVLPADVTDSTGALVDATGMFASLAANATYLVDGLLTFQSAATTTGIAFGFTVPAGASVSGLFRHNVTASTMEGSYGVASGSVKGATSGVLVALENVPVEGRWIIATGNTAGNAQLQFRSEVVASGVTLKAGLSALTFKRIA